MLFNFSFIIFKSCEVQESPRSKPDYQTVKISVLSSLKHWREYYLFKYLSKYWEQTGGTIMY